MASETPKRVRMWSFRRAPSEFQRLFPGGGDSDWVTHVPESERSEVESYLLQWQAVYPVRMTELADRSIVYFGAPSDAMDYIAERGVASGPLPAGRERRAAVRVHIECPSRYETPVQIGFGHTIDVSRSGIAFTTEELLTGDTEVTLQMTWPVRLEGGAPVELHAVGNLARAQAVMAAMQIDRLSFSVEE